MKKYFATALTLLGAVALMLAGMYVYSQPDSGGDETLVTKNIIVGSVEIESRGGDSRRLRSGACTCYGRGDNHGGLPPAVALRSPRDTHSLRKEQKERRVITRLYHLLRCRHYSTTPITHGLLTAIRGLFFTYSTR